MRNKIVICGNYGASNIGDEAILDGLLKIIKCYFLSKSDVNEESSPEITVLSSNPAETIIIHPGVKAVYPVPAGFRSFLKCLVRPEYRRAFCEIKKADLFILGGGGLFTDERPSAVIIWAIQAFTALYYGIPLYCIGQSVGPLNSWWSKFIVRRVFSRAVKVTVRDNLSADLLHQLGFLGVPVLPDPVFSLKSPEPLGSLREDFVVLSLRPWIKTDSAILVDETSKLIDYLWEKHSLRTVLVPFQVAGDNDYALLQSVKEKVSEQSAVELFSYTSDSRIVLKLIAKSRAVIGMRLHSLIFSALTGTPFIALSYSSKVDGLVKQLDLDDYCIPINEFRFDLIKGKIDRLMENRDDLALHIECKVFDLHLQAKNYFENIGL